MPPKRYTPIIRPSSPATSYKNLREWPAPTTALAAARAYLKECAVAQQTTLIVPDKDADGLTAGCIIRRTLLLLGLDEKHLHVHFVAKGSNVHEIEARKRMMAHNASYAIVVDQGSRPGPPLFPAIENREVVKTLLIDHHESDEFPKDTLVLSACKHEPVATSATLAYELCLPMHEAVPNQCDYLCAMGTIGDLGTSFKWEPPFPDMKLCFKRWSKKAINEAVSLVNAPRRTAAFDAESAWKAIIASTSPADILSPNNTYTRRLLAARAEVNAEVERCTHVAPKFSEDGKVALLRISSQAQVHPVIATRWAGHLKSPRLQVVIAANNGYTPGVMHFSCRIARQARSTVDVNIIDMLRSYADREPGLREKMGDNFARGHKQASGGIVKIEDFERLWDVMTRSETVGENREAGKRRKKDEAGQQTLTGWLVERQ
ncbi:DHH phosphoesterase [Neolentinus lepideus HHB14362 ss-1]|uniref:DHH phosphoesterase n=1 Tax=Neolentinus lepideus HHB14362 ss-1 TaxID=1314782 RepID=A0A165S8R7_9AGAM|nr:DHH phosphoesterase [Neolentinus lepideus HHB14362 ss-1]